MVSEAILEKFKRVYQAKFNLIVTDEEATQMLTDLVNLMQVLLKPDSKVTKEDSQQERSSDETVRTLTA